MRKYSVRLVREKTFQYEANISCADEVYDLLCKLGYHMKPQETSGVIMISSSGEVIGFSEVSTGGINFASMSPRDVIQRALLANAAAIMIWHNHPSGRLKASVEDLSVTRRMKEACELMGMRLLDSLIISEYGYESTIRSA